MSTTQILLGVSKTEPEKCSAVVRPFQERVLLLLLASGGAALKDTQLSISDDVRGQKVNSEATLWTVSVVDDCQTLP